MYRLALLACGMAACGDNLLATGDPLAASPTMFVVAHQDDDLLFMQPDLLEAIRSGAGTTTVYVTAGDGQKGTDNANDRYEGLRNAYGVGADSNDWHCGWIDIAGHVAQHCRLRDRPVSLVFLAYPDGGRYGEWEHSLLRLWEGTIDGADTIAERSTHYDRNGLVEVIAQVMRETQPSTIHTLDIPATHGDDHPDHMVVGALALLGMARANNHADLISHRGYNSNDEPVNKLDSVYDATVAMLTRYEACATNCGSCGGTCGSIADTHVKYLHRRYAIGFRSAAAGTLRTGPACLMKDLSLGPCEVAPSWRLDDAGQLRSGDSCLDVGDDGVLGMSACLGGVHHRFFVDDEGHIWSGVPPLPESDLYYAHLWCLAPIDTGVRMQMCGQDRNYVWELAPHTVETARTDLGIDATGREVRLGDITGDGKADLCTANAGLWCAAGDGAGGFETAARLDSVGAPLAIDPRSLVLGDVDGDGRIDACGRDSGGVLCATAMNNFAAARWSRAFADDVAQPGTAASLAAVDANADGIADICGIDAQGVVCVALSYAVVRSQWPSPSGVLWPADLDGDREADWCAATDTGPACAVQAQSQLSTDGAPWGYSFDGVVDVAPATTATVALADIDGDGRADLCSPRDDRITCARSQGRGFGPRMTLAILPKQGVASALWLGDLDGDGRADPCADTGTSIVCAVEPK